MSGQYTDRKLPTPSNGTPEASYGTCEYPWSMGAQETMEAT